MTRAKTTAAPEPVEAEVVVEAAPEPVVDEAPKGLVEFVSEASGQGVWDVENDREAALFVKGAFATDDPRIIAILDATEGVTRA